MRNKKLILIELVITILVLSLLVGLAVPQFIGVKADADVASFKNDIDTLTKAIDESYVKDDSLPLEEKVTITDAALLDTIYSTGDSGTNLYKINLTKSGKYHSKLKSKVNTDSYFIYSMETGKVFYTKAMINGEGQTLYTMEYIGLTGAKIGANPLINGMAIPLTAPGQTITGQVPASATIEVKVNGTNLPVTTEDVVFEGKIDLLAGVKMKSFTSEVLLLEGQNTVTIRVNSQIANFKINLGESTTPVTPEEPAPIIKPIAVISMTPEQGLTTATNITWGTDSSTAAEGRTIVATEWEGKQDIYTTEGSYTVKLKVQDSTGVWSDWAEKSFAVISSDGIKEIVPGGNHSLVLKNDGTLWATGYNAQGQLGTGDTTDKNTYIQVQSGVKSVATGGAHTFIIKEDNTLWATGSNNYGQLGTGDSNNRSTFIQVLSGVKSVSTGGSHTLIIKEDNTLWATGCNINGRLGTGNTIDRNSFIQVQSGVKSVSAGGNHTLIIKEDGTLWTVGENYFGQLGTGSKTHKNTFIQVQTNVKSVSAGSNHTLIVKEDGTLWATGDNQYGQLGTGDTTQKTSFIQVQPNVKSVSAGTGHTFIVKEDGALWATGRNHYGQLGTGDATNMENFIQVNTSVKSVSAGGFQTLILKNDGTLLVTGRNNFGQLGTGNTTDTKTFIQVQY